MVVPYTELFRSRVVGPARGVVVGRFTRLRFPFVDRVVDVAVATDRYAGTTVATPCRALDGFVLRLRHDDRGTQEPVIGDVGFRLTYSIEATDLGIASHLLDAPTRSLIAFTGHVTMPTRRRDRCYSYTIAQGYVRAHAPAAEDSGEALEDVILAVDALARRPDALTAAWRGLARELDAQLRGDAWTVGGGLVLVVPHPTGAFSVTVGCRENGDAARLATRVVDDAQAVVWIDSLAPDAGRIRTAIAQLAAGRARAPYR